MYDKTPVYIPGNIKCISDPNEIVLGYFRVAAAKQTRFFFINNNRKIYVPLYTLCETLYSPSDTSLDSLRRKVIPYLDSGNAIMDTLFEWDNSGEKYYATIKLASSKSCIDCRETGFPATPPDFWIDEKILK